MTCFLAVAEPSFDQAVMASAAAPFDRVVVLPHLLFAGSLLFRLRERIAQQDQASTRQQWLMGDHLGPDPAVAQIIARRFSLVLPSSNVQP
jgi:sirohydrochlorin ferrochelatase